MSFKLKKVSAAITNLNQRKELHGDEVELGIDLNMKVEVKSEVLKPLVGNEDDITARLWDEKGSPRFVAIKDMEIECTLEDYTLVMPGVKYKPVKIKKFKFKPRAGFMADLTFQIQLSSVEPDDVNALSKDYIKDSVKVTIETDQQELI